MVFKLERLEALGTAEPAFLDAHRPDAAASPTSGGSRITRGRHLAEATRAAAAARRIHDVIFRLHRRQR